MGWMFTANAQEILTLEEAIAIGLKNNYGIQIAENQVQIAENTYSLGEAGLLPFVEANAGRNWSSQNVEQQFRNENEPLRRAGARSNGANASIEAGYLLNLSSIFTFQRLGVLSEVSELEAKVTIENTIADVTTAYYRVVLEQQRYEVLQNTIDFSEERLRISKDMYELGRASKQEYLAAQVDYNTDLTALINQEEVISVARIQLNELLAQNSRQEIAIKDTIIVDQELELEDLLSSVKLQNPQLVAAQRRINAAHLQVRELQAARLPQLSLFGAYNRQTSQSEAGFVLVNQTRGFNYGFTASWNLFNGFVLRNRIQNARIGEESQILTYDRLQLELETDVHEAFVAYQNSLRLLEVAQSNYEVAMENADIALERYKLGHTSALEFREAQQNALAAESRLINALFSIKAAEIELQRLTGSIMSAL